MLLLLLDLAQLLDQLLFMLPVGFHAAHGFVEAFHLFVELLQAIPGVPVGFLFQGLALDFGLGDTPLDIVDLGGHAVDLDAQLGGALVHQVDGLVRQEPIGNVAVRQGGRRHDGGILDAHPVVHLVLLLETPQDRNGILHRGLHRQHRLETPLEGRILFDVFAVFLQGGGPHAAQGAARQGRFEHIGGIHGPLGGPGPHQGVQLVDEKNDLALGVLDFFQHGLEAVFELAPVFGPGDQGPHVEGHQPPVLEGFGHVAFHDAAGQPFDDGGLAHTGLADQHRVVLGPAREHLDDAADLFVAADHRVQLARAGQFGKVTAEFLQSLVFFFRIGIGDALGTADLHEHLEQVVAGHAVTFQNGRRFPLLGLRQHQQDVFDADVLVLHFGRFVEGFLDRRPRVG